MLQPRKTSRLKELVCSPSLEFFMEAHNGLSARIAAEAGFPAIWASGLTISASLGLRDNNEATWTQTLELLEFMVDACPAPILLDGDSGHGNFNTFRRLAAKAEQRGVAGICIEDKLYPKTNSFLRDAAHALAPVDEFCGKLKAARDSLNDPDFVFVARTEALIAERGVGEAIRRAEAYRLAGANAIIVHSKKAQPDEVFEFLDEWSDRLPVILIPTTYFSTSAAAFRERRISAIIWANQLLRGSLASMQAIAARVRSSESVAELEASISPLAEVFRLQNDDELQEAERRYMPDSLAGQPATSPEAPVKRPPVDASAFLEACADSGIDFASGTPCSYLAPLITAAEGSCHVAYYGATNEGDAVAMAAGAYTATGRPGLVMFQNSGLGNAVNALSSLSHTFRIPALLIVGHRGEPGGPADEPQHELMGQITTRLLDSLCIPWETFPSSNDEIPAALRRAKEHFQTHSRPYAFVLHKGGIASHSSPAQSTKPHLAAAPSTASGTFARPSENRSSRTEALAALWTSIDPSDVVVSTTGFTSRELWAQHDAAGNFYMVGAMGSASSFALGIALNQAERRVFVIDGDGALLMRMGNLASIGALKPANLIHIVLDNEVHDSTGAQASLSPGVAFAAIAAACGYRNALATEVPEMLTQVARDFQPSSGPSLVHFKIRPGTLQNLGRPKLSPIEVKQRLMKHLGVQ